MAFRYVVVVDIEEEEPHDEHVLGFYVFDGWEKLAGPFSTLKQAREWLVNHLRAKKEATDTRKPPGT